MRFANLTCWLFETTWLCSQKDYEWKEDGAPSQSLEMLCWTHGIIPMPHRALNDAWALGERYLSRIIDQSGRKQYRFAIDPGGRYGQDFRQACIDLDLWRDASGIWSKVVTLKDHPRWEDWWAEFQGDIPDAIRGPVYASYSLQPVAASERYTSRPLSAKPLRLEID